MQHVIFCTNQLYRDHPEIPGMDLLPTPSRPLNLIEITDLVNYNNDPSAKFSMEIQNRNKTRWMTLDSKASITVQETVTEAIQCARQIGAQHDGALIFITGSSRLVGAALYPLEPEPNALPDS